MQTVVVFVVLFLAVAVAVRHFYRMLATDEKGCAGCPLKDTCSKSHPERAVCKPRQEQR